MTSEKEFEEFLKKQLMEKEKELASSTKLLKELQEKINPLRKEVARLTKMKNLFIPNKRVRPRPKQIRQRLPKQEVIYNPETAPKKVVRRKTEATSPSVDWNEDGSLKHD